MTALDARSARPGRGVVCIGIATIDAIVEVERLPRSDERVPGVGAALSGGGTAATAAVTLARLGVPVTFVGRVGEDRTGRWIRDELAAEGVDIHGLQLREGRRSPLSAVLVETATGARALVPDPGDREPFELTTDELERCAAAAWVHVDHRGAAAIPVLVAAGVRTPISVDDGVPDSPRADLRHVALYAPTVAALRRRFPAHDLAGSLAAAVDAGPVAVVATRGGEGAVGVDRDEAGRVRRFDVPGWPVTIRSTLGAGDVFHGALVAELVEGRPLEDAVTRAAACAALSCRGLDGRSAIPDRAELDAFVAAGRAGGAA
jgi:sulfofructose kinase